MHKRGRRPSLGPGEGLTSCIMLAVAPLNIIAFRFLLSRLVGTLKQEKLRLSRTVHLSGTRPGAGWAAGGLGPSDPQCEVQTAGSGLVGGPPCSWI